MDLDAEGHPLPWRCMECSRSQTELLVLPCTHKFCDHCMEHWLATNCPKFTTHCNEVACWLCWAVCQIPQAGIVAYRQNFYIDRLQNQICQISIQQEPTEPKSYQPGMQHRQGNLSMQAYQPNIPPTDMACNSKTNQSRSMQAYCPSVLHPANTSQGNQSNSLEAPKNGYHTSMDIYSYHPTQTAPICYRAHFM